MLQAICVYLSHVIDNVKYIIDRTAMGNTIVAWAFKRDIKYTKTNILRYISFGVL